MNKTYYASSYSRDRGIPNWVSWHLYSADLGSTPRQDDFRNDNSLPAGWYQVQNNAYTGSGFDRGHNTPSGDRTSSVAANSSTFLMTNMIPQAPVNNQQTWANFEDSLRRLVGFGHEVYIVMGNYGTGGSGSNGFATTINSGHVTVPSNIWKIAVVLPNGNGDSARVDASTRVIAINVPNQNNVNSNWKNYRTTIDAIETATGYNLLSRLPASLQAIIEAKIDNL
jgi:endonuclease G